MRTGVITKLLGIVCLCCGFASEPVQRGGKLVVALRAEPKTLNPLTALDGPSREVTGRMNADLITTDRATLLPVPSLAESWSASPDGKHYTVKLRRNVRFSDGQPFDADDVVFSFQAYLDERTNAPQRDLLIVNGVPLGVQKIDRYTVRFDLPSAYATAERLFDGLAMLPRHLLEQSFNGGTISHAWTLNTPAAAIAGMGPFRLKAYRPGERLVLERNPYYRKSGQPFLDELEFLFVGDEDAQVARFLAGETDLINRVSARNAVFLRAHGLNVDDAGPSLEYNFLFFNLTPQAPSPQNAWFELPAFRQAVSKTIDRQSMVKLIFNGLATPLRTHVTPGNRTWALPGGEALAASAADAREILRSAGFTWDHNGLLLDPARRSVEFTILTSSSNAERIQMAAMIQDDLKGIGMTVHLVNLEFRAMADRILRTHDYDAAIMGLGAGDGDPNSEMNVWLSSGTMHIWNPRQPKPASAWEAEIDSLMRRQQVEMDLAARRRLYFRVQQIEAEQLPIISLVSPHVLVARGPRVRHLHPVILDHYTLWNADELFAVNARAELGSKR
jgi:peptide/nickel transport system substrate-binding protein